VVDALGRALTNANARARIVRGVARRIARARVAPPSSSSSRLSQT
jgi:hypothetical protein